jgi:hypothetical protein
MNCDRVFAVLTRGPFPTGDPSDEAVEFHLASCAECRRLAEALRPAARAIDEPGVRSGGMTGRMVEEIVAADERRRLPGYWGEATSEAADEILARFSDGKHSSTLPAPLDQRRRAPGRRLPSIWLFGLAILAGVSLSAMVRYWATAAGPPLWGGAGHRVVSVRGQGGPHADSPKLLATNHELLANLRLPAACSAPPPTPAQPPVAGAADGRARHTLASFAAPTAHQVCCTKCHHAGAGAEIPVAAASTVRRNCVLCHGDMPRPATDAW